VRPGHLFLSLSLLCVAPPARAELVFFATGRSLSVKAHRTEGDFLVLTLRSGGEIICDPATIVRIAPDEAPYPEPDAADAEIRLSASARTARYGETSPKPGVGGQRDLGAVLDLNTPYAQIIDRVAAQQGVDARLVRAVIEVESGYRPRARSAKGAMGLMQLMPATARQYDVTNPYDPAANIEAGTKHLKSLLARFPPALALAAYNAGHAAVERFRGIPPYAETRNYVMRVLQIAGRL
jgi:soluble lytic murein transglycosylase-like protein